MNKPLLSGASSSYDVYSPSHGQYMIIRSYDELTQKYNEAKRVEPDFYRYVTDLHIHLKEFKRPIFKAIMDAEFDTQKPTIPDHSEGLNLEARKMISTLLAKMAHLITLDIMPFPNLHKSKFECQRVENLKVSASYFDEFIHIWNSCKAIKNVTLDGIIPRLLPGDTLKGENGNNWRSLEKNFVVQYLTVTYKSLIMDQQVQLLLSMSPSLVGFHYEEFSEILLPNAIATKIVYLSDHLPSNHIIVNALNNQKYLQSLSFYRDNSYQRLGDFSSLNDDIKKSILTLSTTSRECSLKCIREFESVQDLSLWWTGIINAQSYGRESPIFDLQENLPIGLKSLRLYFTQSFLIGEGRESEKAREKGRKLYVMEISEQFAQLAIYAKNHQFDRLDICIINCNVWYFGPMSVNNDNTVICFGMNDQVERISTKLLPIISGQI